MTSKEKTPDDWQVSEGNEHTDDGVNFSPIVTIPADILAVK
jgi:hypothetical protein